MTNILEGDRAMTEGDRAMTNILEVTYTEILLDIVYFVARIKGLSKWIACGYSIRLAEHCVYIGDDSPEWARVNDRYRDGNINKYGYTGP